MDAINEKEFLARCEAFRADFEQVRSENAALRAELDAADAAYTEGVNSIYESGSE